MRGFNKAVVAAVIMMLLVLTVESFAQRTRVRKPNRGGASGQKGTDKTASRQTPKQELEALPLTMVPKPPPNDSPLLCPLTIDTAPDIAGIKLGMPESYVKGVARHLHQISISGWEHGPYLTYYQISGTQIQHPMPDTQGLESLVEKNKAEAAGGSGSSSSSRSGGQRRSSGIGDQVRINTSGGKITYDFSYDEPLPKSSRPATPKYPFLRGRNEATGTDLREITFGFAKQEQGENLVFMISSSYSSSKVNWNWEDLQAMLANLGIPPSSWVTHTEIPRPTYQSDIMNVFGWKQHKKTAFCKGMTFTVFYDEKGGFGLHMIDYKSLQKGRQQFGAGIKDAQRNVRP